MERAKVKVVPRRSAGDIGGDSLSSGSRLGKAMQGLNQADLAEEQESMMSALGRRSGSFGKAYDDEGSTIGKEEVKPESAEEEEKSQGSGGEEQPKGAGAAEEGRRAEGAAAREGNEC